MPAHDDPDGHLERRYLLTQDELLELRVQATARADTEIQPPTPNG